MRRPASRRIVMGLLCFAVWLTCTAAQAQLFGQRSLGRSLSRRQAPSAEDIGTITSDRRFLREGRDRGDFVGADRGDADGFIGATQGRTSGQVTSSTLGLREETRRNLNRPLQVTRGKRLYAPRLQTELEISPARDAEKSSAIQKHLELSGVSEKWADVAVSVTGRSATLRGSVLSESDRRQAELLMLFEPGIDSVRNEIEVAQPVPQPPAPRLR